MESLRSDRDRGASPAVLFEHLSGSGSDCGLDASALNAQPTVSDSARAALRLARSSHRVVARWDVRQTITIKQLWQLRTGPHSSSLISSGRLSAHKLLHLEPEVRKGNWHPEAEDGEAIPSYAFGEPAKPLQVPAPAIRVPQGTTIDISLRSFLPVAATLHGLHQRPGSDRDVVIVEAGATQHIRFAAGTPGTYLYWARTTDGRLPNGRGFDALLGGALVVDPPGADPSRALWLQRVALV